jgi:hypothetical protein
MDTQYDGFEFVSDGTNNWHIMGGSGSGGGGAFTSLTDTPANYTGAANKLVRVNATPDALEFVTPTFLLGTDTPANYTGAANKFVKVNGTPDALVFATAAFTDLSDTPASLSGQGGKTVKVNSGGTALEFVDLVPNIGIPLKHITRGHLAADSDQTINSSDTTIDLPSLMSSSGTDVTWNATNDEFEINVDGTYLLMAQLTSDDASQHNVVMFMELDTGSGYVSIDETTSFQGFAVRNQNFAQTVRVLSAGDTVRLRARDLSSVAPVAREGTNMSIIRLDVSIENGGDMEVFQQGLDGAETSALTTGSMAAVDLQSNIINNAPDLYTFTPAIDSVTFNEAGIYLISYTITADETVSTLTTAAKLQKDIGAGWVDIDGSQSNGGGADKFSHGNAVIIELNATDDVRLQAQDITGDGNCIAGTMLRIVRLKRGSDAIDYSTTEHKTGRKWIDGKDVYRKVITASGNMSTGLTNYAHSITGLDRMIEVSGHALRDDAKTQQVPIPYPNDSATTLIIIVPDDTNIAVNVGSFWTGAGNTLSEPRFVVEYTKT